MPSQVLGFGKEFTGYKDRAKPGEILRPIEDPVNYEPNAKTDYSKIGEPTKEIDLSSYFEVRASSGGRASQLEPHCGALMLAGWASVAPCHRRQLQTYPAFPDATRQHGSSGRGHGQAWR